MKQTYSITGMTCTGCQAKVANLLQQIQGIKRVTVNLAAAEAEIDLDKHIPIEQLKNVLKDYPKYQIHEKINTTKKPHTTLARPTSSWLTTYYPLLLIVGYIVVVSLIASFKNDLLDINEWMNSFMAGFFIVFSFFKLLDIRGFAVSYAMYDIVAKRIRYYGFVYPFIELALGIAYLTHFNPVLTSIATIVIMGISLIGVIKSVVNKQPIQCACLGTVFNLPMSTITIIEDLGMIMMAVMLLIMNH